MSTDRVTVDGWCVLLDGELFVVSRGDPEFTADHLRRALAAAEKRGAESEREAVLELVKDYRRERASYVKAWDTLSAVIAKIRARSQA